MIDKIWNKYWNDITPTIKTTSISDVIVTSTPTNNYVLTWTGDYWTPSIFDDTQSKKELRNKKLDSL